MLKYKKIGIQLLFVFVLFVIPKTTFAETITVKVRNGGYTDADNIAEVEAEANVTTLDQLKQTLANTLDMTQYVPVDGSLNELSDTLVVCQESLSCYGPTNGRFTVLNLASLDSSKIDKTVKAIQPTNRDTFVGIAETNYELFEPLAYKSCNDDYTICTFADYQKMKLYNNVHMNYVYDEEVKTLVDRIISVNLLNKTEFTLTDTEFLHYLNYGGMLADYSSDFKNQLTNLNFRFEMDPRGGGYDPFGTEEIGFYKFIYENTLYGVKDFMRVAAPHIIYLPSDTVDVLAAIEARLEEIFGDELKLSVVESTDTINEMLTVQGFPTETDGDQHYYIITCENEDSWLYTMEFYFKAVKDSTKVNNEVEFKTSDLVTNISISTAAKLPLDTLMKVLTIKSGTEYDRIMGILNITNGEMYDISLFSNNQNRNITTLANGKFLVSLPIPDGVNPEDLVVYYVDGNDEIHVYAVDLNVVPGMASFETDHFSVYTLAATPTTTNPLTGDQILMLYLLSGISLIGIAGTSYFLLKKNN